MRREASVMMNSQPPVADGERLSRPAFLRLLFRLLDQHDVRYCVLHSYEGLPDELLSDLDLAVHPNDVSNVPYVFRKLHEKGYQLVQHRNYAVNGKDFIFVWFEGVALNYAAVDIITQHRRAGLILTPGEELVAGRQKRGDFWMPDPRVEFAYLLAKKTLKGTVPAHQEMKLKLLAEELGRPEAEKVAGKLFGKSSTTQVVEGCTRGCAGDLLGKLRKKLWCTTAASDPVNPIRCLLANAVRLTRRWFQPTGLFVVVLGPDGVGKSTLSEQLMQVLRPAFRRHAIFHWRPMLLWPRKSTGPVTAPHALPARSPLSSVARLFGLLLDYWFGYLVIVRPLLARSGLVVFDREFHDLLVDPKRYRYGGPIWLARVLSHVIPGPDLLFLVLDAQEEVILSRKREVLPDELRRQREVYNRFRRKMPRAVLVATDRDLDQTVAEASRAIMEHLARRFQRRHASWLACNDTSGVRNHAEVTKP